MEIERVFRIWLSCMAPLFVFFYYIAFDLAMFGLNRLGTYSGFVLFGLSVAVPICGVIAWIATKPRRSL